MKIRLLIFKNKSNYFQNKAKEYNNSLDCPDFEYCNDRKQAILAFAKELDDK